MTKATISATRPPKMLPWLARQAGISDERAAVLWEEALYCASRSEPHANSDAYWRKAVDGLRRRIAADVAAASEAPFGFGPWLRLPARLWLLGLPGFAAVAAAGVRRWRAPRSPHCSA
jgi:hypothetical protein